jgi:hypothetical protein
MTHPSQESEPRTEALADVQHYSLTIEPDDSAYMELDPDGRYVIAEEVEDVIAALREQAATEARRELDVDVLAQALADMNIWERTVKAETTDILADQLAAEYRRLIDD